MLLKEIAPAAFLQDYIRVFRIIDFEFPGGETIPPKAYPPRPEHCLQFFPTPTAITYPEDDMAIIPKNALLIGQHTVVNNRTVYKKFLSLQVVFKPGALFCLLGIPTGYFSNKAIEAEELIGREVAFVNEQLYHAKDHANMIAIVELFLKGLIKKSKKEFHPVDHVSLEMLQGKEHGLDHFIRCTYLSHRQFDRRFAERMGITAKEYIRVVRFYEAYLLKNRFPDKDWLTIALHCGYYDYQHLTRDYKEFTGYSPAKFFALDSPERVLGAEEIY